MPRLYLYFFLVVLLGCSAKKDQVEKPPIQPYSGNAKHGKLLYSICATCHGDAGQGNPKMNAPALTNADDWYLKRQLSNFNKGLRGYSGLDTLGFQMAAMARTLPDSFAIADVTAYIKTFPETIPAITITGDIKKGERAYQSNCGSCHGQGAKGNQKMHAPRLSGMNDWYLRRQLGKFKNNIRGTHPDDQLGAQMASMAALLPDDEAVNNIIAYINSTTSPAKK